MAVATRGLTAKGVPPQPSWLLILKGVIIVLSLIILALAAYAISVVGSFYSYYYGTGAAGYMIFIVIKTLLIFGGMLALERFAPNAFYRLLALIAYGLSIIFWLSGWTWCASWAAGYLSLTSPTLNSDNYYARVGGALAACAGLGAITWILCIVHLVFFTQACIRNPDPTVPAVAGAELGNMPSKPEANVAQQPYPAQQYPAQPYPAQQQYPVQYPAQTYPQQPYPPQQQPYGQPPYSQ